MRLNHLLAAALLVAGLVLSGCGSDQENAPPPPPARSTITVYSNGEAVKTFIATNAGANQGTGYGIAEGATVYTYVGGTFAVEPLNNPSGAERTADAKLKVTIFSGDKAVRVWYATEGASNSGIGYFKTPGGSNWTYVGGTYVVEPLPQ